MKQNPGKLAYFLFFFFAFVIVGGVFFRGGGGALRLNAVLGAVAQRGK